MAKRHHAPVINADPNALPRLLPAQPDPSLGAHLARLGPMPRTGSALRHEVVASGLRGRGGSGFPTGTKMETVAGNSRLKRTTVVANGTEGEPASGKDQILLTNVPHLVLDGIVAAAGAVGARDAVLCVDRRHHAVVESVNRALAERTGPHADPIEIRLALAPNRYVSGEETALIHWINGGEAKPTTTPPRPFERGVGGRPTLVDNVETLAHVALIARFGSRWFRGMGTDDEPGSVLLSISGQAPNGGVMEVPIGLPLTSVLQMAGTDLDQVGAVLVGGYFGSWLDVSTAAAVTVSHASLRSAGGSLGCGVVFALARGRCGLAETARVARWLAGENAGQCGPCMNGLPAMADAMDHLVAGGRHASWARLRLQELFGLVEGRGACRHPDGAVRLVRSALQVFAADVDAHAAGRPCAPSPAWLPAPVPGPWR
jgi:NADH:ubiquinone oxidoreductase subunit F (NADH-binding)